MRSWDGCMILDMTRLSQSGKYILFDILLLVIRFSCQVTSLQTSVLEFAKKLTPDTCAWKFMLSGSNGPDQTHY